MERKKLNHPESFGETIVYREGTIHGPSSFFHAVENALNRHYQHESEQGRHAIVQQLRSYLASQLSFDQMNYYFFSDLLLFFDTEFRSTISMIFENMHSVKKPTSIYLALQTFTSSADFFETIGPAWSSLDKTLDGWINYILEKIHERTISQSLDTTIIFILEYIVKQEYRKIQRLIASFNKKVPTICHRYISDYFKVNIIIYDMKTHQAEYSPLFYTSSIILGVLEGHYETIGIKEDTWCTVWDNDHPFMINFLKNHPI